MVARIGSCMINADQSGYDSECNAIAFAIVLFWRMYCGQSNGGVRRQNCRRTGPWCGRAHELTQRVLRQARAGLGGTNCTARQSGCKSEKCTAGRPSTVTKSVPSVHDVPGLIQGGTPFG